MTRALGWAVAGFTAAATTTGLVSAFRYRPDATGFLLGVQRLHAATGIAAAVLLVVWLAVLVWARRPERRHGLPAFALLGVIVVLLVVELSIGFSIAWDQVALEAVTMGLDVRGVLLSDHPVKFLIVDGSAVGVDEFRRAVWLHLLVLPVLVSALAAGVIVLARRSDARKSGGVGG